jgi:hypothetical protein
MNHLAKFAAITLLPLALLGMRCDRPVNPTPVPAAGGSVSTGGNPATGGVTPVAGAAGQAGGVSTGGIAATGGATCAAYVEPTCASSGSVLSPERKAELKRQLTGWHKSPPNQASRWRPTYALLPVCSVFWTPNNQMPFAQRRGSCTTNTVGGVLSTQPFSGRLTQDDVDERIYPLATLLDPFVGNFPPTDTGSDNQSAWKAAVQLGYTTIPSTPISSLEELQSAMQRVTCMVGVDWYDSMFSPTRCGEMTIGGSIAGGHAMHVIGINLTTKKVWVRNSWDFSWGLSRGNEVGGYAYFSFGTLQKLLNAGGELDCPANPPPAREMHWSDSK